MSAVHGEPQLTLGGVFSQRHRREVRRAGRPARARLPACATWLFVVGETEEGGAMIKMMLGCASALLLTACAATQLPATSAPNAVCAPVSCTVYGSATPPRAEPAGHNHVYYRGPF